MSESQKQASGILLETALANPETYGFKWTTGKINGDNGKRPLGTIPLIQWTSTSLAAKYLGEPFMLELVNGSQSSTVQIQNKFRPLLEKGEIKKDDLKTMRRMIVEEWLMGGGTRRVRTVTETVYTDLNGGMHNTKDSADRANTAIQLERSQAQIARLVDRGFSVEEAKEALGLTEAPSEQESETPAEQTA